MKDTSNRVLLAKSLDLTFAVVLLERNYLSLVVTTVKKYYSIFSNSECLLRTKYYTEVQRVNER